MQVVILPVKFKFMAVKERQIRLRVFSDRTRMKRVLVISVGDTGKFSISVQFLTIRKNYFSDGDPSIICALRARLEFSTSLLVNPSTSPP